MKATICDRCGKPYEGTKRGQRAYEVRRVKNETVRKQMSRGTQFDLCPACYTNFLKWIGDE